MSEVRARIFFRSFIGAAHIIVSLYFIWLSKHMVDVAIGSQQESIVGSVIQMAVCVLLQIALSSVGSRLDVKNSTTLRNGLRYRFFRHIMTSKWSGREGMHTGEMMNRLESDVYKVADTMSRTLPAVLISGFQFVVAFIFLGSFDWRLSVAMVVIMPMALLASKAYVKYTRRYNKDIREMDSRLSAYMQENIQNRTLISTMKYTPQTMDDFESMQSTLGDKILRYTDFSLFSRRMVQLGFALGYLVGFTWCIIGLREGSISFGVMTALLQLVAQVQRPIVEFTRQLPSFIHITTSLDRLADISNMPLELFDDEVRLSGNVGVRVKDVEFSYPSDGLVIKGLNCDIKPLSMNAVVGPTGIGKSSLVRLILALVEPQKGSIELYDDTQSVKVSSATRCNIAYVPQGNSLLSGTVRSNLLLANPNATDEQMREALHTAVADFVFDLREGLDTQCMEKGSGFSEGQAQRIAIARGLLRSGSVLLLDEPTASLDIETEKTLLQRIREYANNKTIIIITHSATTATKCENIISLD